MSTDGGRDGPGAGRCKASIFAAFCGERTKAGIVDDTEFPKKGRHSVGVSRQYCGWLGQAGQLPSRGLTVFGKSRCQSAIAYRLYMPEDWAKDQARRDKARVPETITFQTKPEIAFEQIKVARATGLPEGVVLRDAGYGTDIATLGLRYVAGIGSNTSVWSRTPADTVAARTAPADLGQDTRLQPAARSVANDAWPGDEPSRPSIGCPPCPKRPRSIVGSSVIAKSSSRNSALVSMRRGWRGCHHHATLCIAAYGFLITERGALSPQDHLSLRRSRDLPFPVVTDPEAPPIRLVVEDDEDVRTNTVMMVEELGYRVLEASDGMAALRVLEQHSGVCLLFTNAGLPGGLNGRQLADKAREIRPEIAVLFTPGYARNAIVHNGRLDPGVEMIGNRLSFRRLRQSSTRCSIHPPNGTANSYPSDLCARGGAPYAELVADSVVCGG